MILKPHLRVLFLLLSALLAAFAPAAAQRVVVSEYFNMNTSPPIAEWSELLVVQDSTTLVGYTLRDKGSAETWQGGVRFRDVRLWRSMRAGTIIVLNHRGSVEVDVNPDDGYIQVGIENATYFEKFLDAAPDWEQTMNINQTNEILQLRDASGQHVHALGHAATPSTEYTSMPQPKLNHGNNIANPGSLRVYPGRSLSDYADPNPGNTKTSDNVANVTLGRPNKNTAGEDENQQFWRSLRQPEWNAPSLTATSVTAANVPLRWNAATNPVPSDGVQGYLLLRRSDSLADTNQSPQDGKTYSPNDRLGSWVVIGNVPAAQTTFDDAVSIPCGETFKYRVYAYRYKQDDLEIITTLFPNLARGRSYNETAFAQIRVTRQFPSLPTVTASGGVSFCKGGGVELSVPAPPLGQLLQWQKDNNDIPGQTNRTLTVTTTGRYRVKITNETGCTAQSNEVEVIAHEPPVAAIIPAQPAKLCAGDALTLTATFAQRYQWIKDGAPLAGETRQTHNATLPGAYRVVVIDYNGCSDTSAAATIVLREVKFAAAADTLDFGRLDDCTSGKLDSIVISNTGADTLRLDKVAAGVGFSYVAPPATVIIPPGKQAALTFRFTPAGTGTSVAAADVIVQPCSASLRLYLKGAKDKATVTASLQAVNFGTGLSCNVIRKDTVITVKNGSTLPLRVQGQIVSSPYSIATQAFPVDIPALDSLRLTLRYDPQIDGTFSSTLQLPFLTGACRDTLRIDLQGVRTTPALAASISTLQFPPLLGCENERDTAVSVRNTGIVPATISAQPANPNFRFMNVPLTVNPGEEQQLAVRFAPVAEGSVSFNLPVIITPCNRTAFEIQVSGSKQGTTFALDADTLDFGEIASCSGVKSASRFVKIRIAGAAAGARLLTALTDAPFGAQFNSGLNVKDNDSLEFVFTPAADGDFTGNAALTFDPCGVKKTIVLRGRRVTQAFVMSDNSLDFGSIDTGTTATRQFTLRNSGSAMLTVTAENIAAPFRVIAASPALPAVLPKDSVLILTLEYAPLLVQRDSADAGIRLTAPCDAVRTLTLLGNGKSTGLPPDTSAIPGVLRIAGGQADAGKIVSLPVSLTSDSLALAQITSLTFTLMFNGTMLMPRSMNAGADLPPGCRVRFTESSPGTLTVEITDPVNFSLLRAGELAVLNCEALLGNAVSTPLALSPPRVIRSGRNVRITLAQPEIFTLTGECPPQERLIDLGRRAGLAVHAAGGDVEITADVPSNDATSIVLYDNLGRVAAVVLSGELPVGSHVVRIAGNSLPDGAYYLVMRSGAVARTLPFALVR